jgi:hypothetical protein
MSKTDAFAAVRAARALRERHPDAPPGTVLVALALATYANGRTGTSIRPGYARVAAITGLHPQTVKRAVAWLVARQELRRDKAAHPGSAACFTWVGGMEVPGAPTSEGTGVPGVPDSGVQGTPHQPNQPSPTSPSGSRAGTHCRKHPEVELYLGDCFECERETYYATYGAPPAHIWPPASPADAPGNRR